MDAYKLRDYDPILHIPNSELFLFVALFLPASQPSSAHGVILVQGDFGQPETVLFEDDREEFE